MGIIMLKISLSLLPILISVAFFTLLERKILSLVGLRVGPNKVSFLGILQPIGDAAKLANKSSNYISNFSFFFYFLSSFLMILFSLILINCIFFCPSLVSLKYSILFFLLILGLNSLNSMICGWSTFSKFSLLGSLRTISQLISYEAVLYLCLFFLVIFFSSFDFCSFSYSGLNFSFFLIFPCFYIWIPSILAELNRSPYDFSEGESELVSGFNTEHGSLGFTLIFLSEYSNILFFCIISSFFFFYPMLFFSLFLIFFVVWIRSVLPRYRFDKLMSLAWTFFIPFLTLYFLLMFLFFF